MNEQIPTTTAKKVFESVTKKYHRFLLNFTDSHVQQTTERQHRTILVIVNNPHSFVLKIYLLGIIVCMMKLNTKP